MLPSEELCIFLNQAAQYGQQQANEFLKGFLTYLIKKDRFLLLQLEKTLKSNPQDPMVLLRTKFLANPTFPRSYTNKFYELLKKQYYLEEAEILECISFIAENPEQDYSFWLRSPWIKDIKFDESTKMHVISTTKGQFSFVPFAKMYPSERDTLQKIAKDSSSETPKPYQNGYNPSSLETFDYQCHFVSYEFAKLHPEFYATTCVCPNCFPKSYWLHSYNRSYNQAYVVDIANGFVMSTEEFNRLITPTILDQTVGYDIPFKLQEIKKDSSCPYAHLATTNPLKTLAFYQYDQRSAEERNVKYSHLSIKRK